MTEVALFGCIDFRMAGLLNPKSSDIQPFVFGNEFRCMSRPWGCSSCSTFIFPRNQFWREAHSSSVHEQTNWRTVAFVPTSDTTNVDQPPIQQTPETGVCGETSPTSYFREISSNDTSFIAVFFVRKLVDGAKGTA